VRVYTWMKKPGVITLLALVVHTSGYVLYRVETGNFHTVLPGKVYRSGQMDEAQWMDYMQKYAIKSVLNLRGEHRASPWYQQEIRVAEKLGITHYNVGLSASREVDNETLETILGIIRQAPKPILIHCQAGADRSSLIAAAYLFAIEGQLAETAAHQLSILYGHFPYLLSKTDAMDRSFWRYVGSRSSLQGAQ
jgi:protein tyrosine/serine phosphatase